MYRVILTMLFVVFSATTYAEKSPLCSIPKTIGQTDTLRQTATEHFFAGAILSSFYLECRSTFKAIEHLEKAAMLGLFKSLPLLCSNHQNAETPVAMRWCYLAARAGDRDAAGNLKLMREWNGEKAYASEIEEAERIYRTMKAAQRKMLEQGWNSNRVAEGL